MNEFMNYLFILLPMLLVAVLFWLLNLRLKDVSIVDSVWSVFFIVFALSVYLQQESPGLRAGVVLLLVLIWAVRLSLHITVRHWGHEEDHRYKTIRENNSPGFEFKSLYMIFIFQAIIAWIIAMPIYFSMASKSMWCLFDMIAIGLWLAGMLFESVADYQLYLFKKNSENSGGILTSGLWKYSRHPNYFGEFLIWWGFFFFVLSSADYVAIISPLIMTFILLKFSGVGLLEKTMKTRPGYEEYMKNTNAFLPGFLRVWFPRCKKTEVVSVDE